MANKRILIVEDESIVALDLAVSLKNLGYIILDVVDSGKEAVKKAETLQPDIVLMDIILKGEMDGIEAASQIRARFDIPLIYLTAFGDELTLQRAMITEPFGYILKPFKERELNIAIEVSLYKHEMDTKIRKMERWLAITLRSIGDVVITTDTEGHITFMNHAAETLTGLKQEGALKKNLTYVLTIKELEKLDLVESIKTTIKEDSVIELNSDYSVFVKKDGTEIPIAGSFGPIRDEKGNVSGVVIVLRDITGQKKAEEMRLENEQSAYANKLKSEFFSVMSHELRTPLNAIIGFTELLLQTSGKLDEKQMNFLNNINTGGKRLHSIIENILELTRTGVETKELSVEKIPVTKTINDVLNLIKDNAANRNIIIKTEFDPRLNFIEADRQKLKLVLFKLLDNAVKFSKKEGGTVIVTTKKEMEMAMFSVSDTGIGIKEEDMGKLFVSLQQIDMGMSRKYGGVGTGLAISKKLVELHGGRIWAESRFGEGSTFTFMLPIKAKKKEEK